MAQTVAVNRSEHENKQPLKQPPVASDEPPSKRGRQAPKPVRGVFEHPPNSGIWWVNYYVDGKRHREKVGTRKAASDLYSKRKNDARMGLKLPDSLKAKRAILFEELARDAMEYSKAHKKSHRGDISNLSSLLPVFGKMKAEEITPQTISAYFSTRTDLKPASINRYRSTMSMIFAEGSHATSPAIEVAGDVRLPDYKFSISQVSQGFAKRLLRHLLYRSKQPAPKSQHGSWALFCCAAKTGLTQSNPVLPSAQYAFVLSRAKFICRLRSIARIAWIDCAFPVMIHLGAAKSATESIKVCSTSKRWERSGVFLTSFAFESPVR
jgi:hypothetical protein